MPRRILHIVDSLARTGVARQLLMVSQALVSDEWQVRVAALGGPSRRPAGDFRQDFADNNVAVAYIGRRLAIDPAADVRLARHIAKVQPDIIHTWNVMSSQLAPLLLRKPGGHRIIAGQYRINAQTPSWEWLLLRRFAARFDRFVANSETVRDACLSHGVPAEKLVVIPGGAATFSAPLEGSRRGGGESIARADLLAEFCLPPDAKLIGIIGRLIPEKCVKDLIWAADLLRVLHDNLRVLIIGDGPLRGQLQRYARMASDLEHIQFLGERADVNRILPHLDVLWNGSENTGPSIAILEVMAAGVPVVASDTPSNREFIIEGETGHLIPLGTRAGRAARARVTDRIFADASLAERLGGRAQERSQKHFSDENCVQKYTALYEQPGG